MHDAVARAATDGNRDVLVAILDELRILNTKLPAARPAVAADDAAFKDLLTAIAATTQGLKFSVNELLLHAEVVFGHAGDRRLHAALIAACGGVNGRRLGKLLSRLEGRELDGLRVVRAGMGRDGIVWRVAGLRVSNPPITVAAARAMSDAAGI